MVYTQIAYLKGMVLRNDNCVSYPLLPEGLSNHCNTYAYVGPPHLQTASLERVEGYQALSPSGQSE